MKLTENVYLVGSGHYGLSHEFDSSIYIIDCNSELVMIDTGAGCNIERVMNNIKKDGLDPKNISAILLTHSHADHAGGANRLKELYGCKVYISEIESDFISTNDESKLKLDVAKRSGLYSPDYVFTPCETSETLKDNDSIKIGNSIFKAIIVPGHSEGSICYKVKLPEGEALFTGDVVFAEGVIGLLNCDGSDLSDYRQNIHKLSNLNIDLLFPGHFVFVLSGGQKHVDKAIKALSFIVVPKSFI